MASEARWRAGNNVGVESARAIHVFVEAPVLPCVSVLPMDLLEKERLLLNSSWGLVWPESTYGHSLACHTASCEVC